MNIAFAGTGTINKVHAQAAQKGVDDVIAAIKKVQKNAEELNKAAKGLRKQYRK